jgi:hypothetical protein
VDHCSISSSKLLRNLDGDNADLVGDADSLAGSWTVPLLEIDDLGLIMAVRELLSLRWNSGAV